jgi:hypothetical protein
MNNQHNVHAVYQGDGTQMQLIENDINLIQQQQDRSQSQCMQLQYEGDEQDIICGRFPHL